MKWTIFVGDLMSLYFTWGETFFKVRNIKSNWIFLHCNYLRCKNWFRLFENHELIAALIILTFCHLPTVFFVFSFANINILLVLTELFLICAYVWQFTSIDKIKWAVATFGWIEYPTFRNLFGRTPIQTYVLLRFLIHCLVTFYWAFIWIFKLN